MRKVTAISISLILSLLTLFFTTSAVAARFVKVPAIEVQNTGNYLGSYLTVYYGFEKTSILRPHDDFVNLHSVRHQVSKKIEGDKVLIPSVELEKAGIRGAYDTIVVVISPEQNFVWKNADQSIPSGLVDSKVYNLTLVRFKKSSEIESFLGSNPEATVFPWPIR